MISVDMDPALVPGDPLEIELELPQIGLICVPSTVRWVSAVLPGMIGIEFDPPMQPELLAYLASLIRRPIDEAQGF